MPIVDTIDETCVRMRQGVRPQPLQLDALRIVATARLMLDVATLSLAA